jgi:hypothetical protein
MDCKVLPQQSVCIVSCSLNTSDVVNLLVALMHLSIDIHSSLLSLVTLVMWWV